jgi:hypothetical protein
MTQLKHSYVTCKKSYVVVVVVAAVHDVKLQFRFMSLPHVTTPFFQLLQLVCDDHIAFLKSTSTQIRRRFAYKTT